MAGFRRPAGFLRSVNVCYVFDFQLCSDDVYTTIVFGKNIAHMLTYPYGIVLYGHGFTARFFIDAPYHN
jgi:hypothetical protein